MSIKTHFALQAGLAVVCGGKIMLSPGSTMLDGLAAGAMAGLLIGDAVYRIREHNREQRQLRDAKKAESRHFDQS